MCGDGNCVCGLSDVYAFLLSRLLPIKIGLAQRYLFVYRYFLYFSSHSSFFPIISLSAQCHCILEDEHNIAVMGSIASLCVYRFDKGHLLGIYKHTESHGSFLATGCSNQHGNMLDF